MSSLFIGSPLEAAHEAARKAYPLATVEDITDGEVMALRAPVIEYGPRVIAQAEQAAIQPYQTEIAVGMAEAAAGVAAIEETLGLERQLTNKLERPRRI